MTLMRASATLYAGSTTADDLAALIRVSQLSTSGGGHGRLLDYLIILCTARQPHASRPGSGPDGHELLCAFGGQIPPRIRSLAVPVAAACWRAGDQRRGYSR